MKLRKLILHSKLKQFEKQNQNIIIYHCNLTAAEWRLFKNFLHHNSSSVRQKTLNETSKVLLDFDTSNQKGTRQIYRVFFLSKSSSDISGPTMANSLEKSKQKTIKPTGCLVFLDKSFENSFQDLHQSSLQLLKIIKKLESSDLNKNLLFLYGQLSHIALNHLDIEKALQLNTQKTYQQFLFSVSSLGNVLNFFFYQNINEFIQLQDKRTILFSRDQRNENGTDQQKLLRKPEYTGANNGT